MKKIFYFLIPIIVIALLAFSNHCKNESTTNIIKEKDTFYLTLTFAGDIMGHDEQITGAYNDTLKKYNYDSCFRFIKPYIQQCDIAIANLEVVLGIKPYTGYPAFSSPTELAIASKNAGFDYLLTANNHCLDRGKRGLEKTISLLDSLTIIHTGTFRNQTERDSLYPLIIIKNNIKIALLNYTYGTNGIQVDSPNIVNYIDTIQIAKDLNKAKLLHPDFIITTLHWGLEYENLQNKNQEKLAAFIFKNGSDAIIGSHPHVVQPIFYKKDSISITQPIVYSLGNYISNQRARYKDGGIMIELKLMKTDSTKSIQDINYMPTWVNRYLVGKKYKFEILPVALYEKDSCITKIDKTAIDKITLFSTDTREHLKNVKENKFLEYNKK